MHKLAKKGQVSGSAWAGYVDKKAVLWIRSTFCNPPYRQSHSFPHWEDRVFFFCLNETVFYSSAVPQQGEGKKHLEDIFSFSPLFFPSFSLGSADSTMTAIASRCENTNSRSHSLLFLQSQMPRNKRKPSMLVHLWLFAPKTHISHDALGCSSHADTELAALVQVCRECYFRGSVCTCVSFMTALGNLRTS